MMHQFCKLCFLDRPIDHLSRQCSYAVCNTTLGEVNAAIAKSLKVLQNKLNGKKLILKFYLFTKYLIQPD